MADNNSLMPAMGSYSAGLPVTFVKCSRKGFQSDFCFCVVDFNGERKLSVEFRSNERRRLAYRR